MPETLYDYYQAIENASRQMLEAAQTENWDQVVRYEGACAVLIEQLRHKSQHQELSAEERKDKDAEVRLLTEPWLSELDELLSPQTAQRLH
jgi:flagellar protein FliT